MFFPVKFGKRFFPPYSGVLDNTMNDEAKLVSLGRDTSTEKKWRLHLLLKEFDEDKEFGKFSISRDAWFITTFCQAKV
jgi:hypothetical protein